MPVETTPFEGWCILEVMGRNRLAGYVREETRFGVGLIRIEVPEGDGPESFTQWYHPNALYRLTPTTEQVARAMAKQSEPEPVQRWELRQIEAPKRRPVQEQCSECAETLEEGEYRLCRSCQDEIADERAQQRHDEHTNDYDPAAECYPRAHGRLGAD